MIEEYGPVAIACAFAAFAVTQPAKLFLKGYWADKDPWWSDGLFRTISVVAGALTGLFWGVPEGLIAGAAGGACSTFFVSQWIRKNDQSRVREACERTDHLDDNEPDGG